MARRPYAVLVALVASACANGTSPAVVPSPGATPTAGERADAFAPTTGVLLSTGRTVPRDLVRDGCQRRFIGAGGNQAVADVLGQQVGKYPTMFAGVSYSSHYRDVEIYVVRAQVRAARALLLKAVPPKSRSLVVLVPITRSSATMTKQAAAFLSATRALGTTGVGPYPEADGLMVDVQPTLLVRRGTLWMPKDASADARMRALGATCYEPMGEAVAAG